MATAEILRPPGRFLLPFARPFLLKWRRTEMAFSRALMTGSVAKRRVPIGFASM